MVGAFFRVAFVQLRVECLDAPAHMNKKIKQARKEKVPFLLIAGDAEVADGSVTVSQRGLEEQTRVDFDEFVARAKRLVATRSLALD